MTIIVVENLRGFFNSRPPLVLFMICLASFAIALITFAYLVRIRELPNPDVAEDWNTILSKFSNLEFCVSGKTPAEGVSSSGNSSSSSHDAKMKIGEQHPADVLQDIHNSIKGGSSSGFKEGSTPEAQTSAPRPKEKRDVRQQLRKGALSQALLSSTPGGAENTNNPSFGTGHFEASTIGSGTESNLPQNFTSVTLPLNMKIAPNAELRAVSLKMARLTAVVSRKILKLNGPKKDQTMQISLSFPMNLSHDFCEEWAGKECTLYIVNTCVTFSGPAAMFPRTQRPANSAVCEKEVPAMTGDSYIRNMTAGILTVSSAWCAGGSRLAAEYSFDDALTVLLSQQDRSIINLHLMRTSYFLFVMVITLFCYAMVKGRPAKVKTVHIPYEKVTTIV